MLTVRTFVAIQLPAFVLDRLAEVQSQLRQGPGGRAGRWVRVGGIHLTLKFLGDTPMDKLDAIYDAVARSCSGREPFDITLAGLGCFPNTRRPRVIWVGVREERLALQGLHAAIEQALEELGYAPERRPFSPHLTLARIDQRASQGATAQLGEQVARAPVGALASLRVETVHMIKSDLRPQGAVYTPLFEERLIG